MNMRRHYRNLSITIEKQSCIILYLFAALCVSMAMNIAQLSYNLGYTFEPLMDVTRNITNTAITAKSSVEKVLAMRFIRPKENIYVSVTSDELEQEPVVIEEIANINAVEEPVVVVETKKPETELLGNEEISIEDVRLAIETISPALLGCEEAILYNYHTYGLKPSYQLAVFCLESGYGESNLARNKNNISSERAYPYKGLTAYEHAITFDTKADCVISFGELMVSGYDLTSLETVAYVYCPPNAEQWIVSVRNLMNRFEVII